MAMTRAYPTATGRRTIVAGAVVGLLTLSGAALASIANGQAPGLLDKLKAGTTCVEPDAAKRLQRNVDASAAERTSLLTALDEISIDPKACAPIRDAASALAMELSKAKTTPDPEPDHTVDVDPDPDLDPEAAEADDAAASVARMQQALAEADLRAASMRFEVGPPPRNLTRSRAAPQ